MDIISLAPAGDSWGVKHCGSYLGHVRTFEEAMSVARELAGWLESQGRAAALVTEAGPAARREPRSFAHRD